MAGVVRASGCCAVALAGLLACVPATLTFPPDPQVVGELLLNIEPGPALSDAELDELGLIAVLPPDCWRDDSQTPLVLAWKQAASIPDRNWREYCSSQPLVVTYAPNDSRPLHAYYVKRSGHLFTSVEHGGVWTSAVTSTDLVGMREQLEATPGWSAVDEQRFAAWLGVDPQYASPGRRHALPLDGDSWFLEEDWNVDPQSGCPLSSVVEQHGIVQFDGRTVTTLLGPRRSPNRVLLLWEEELRRKRPPLLLLEAGDPSDAMQIVGNQLVDYPRCTVGEIAVAADWLKRHRWDLPRLPSDETPAARVEWLFAAHATVSESPFALPNLAAVMRRHYMILLSLQAALTWDPAYEAEVYATVGAWFEDPTNLAQQPIVLHDLAAGPAEFGGSLLDVNLLEHVFPRLLEADAIWWEAVVAGPTRSSRAQRDTFMLAHEAKLPRRARPIIDRLCAAWRRAPAAAEPDEPTPCAARR
jgi:hypothetical protein